MTEHIQIGDVSPRIRYVADGATVDFTYPFPIFDAADLDVFVDAVLQTLSTDYTVAGAGVSAGGTVSFITAPADGASVTLVRRLAIKRTSDFQASGEFRAKVINDELDFQTAALQQVEDDQARSLRLSRFDDAAALELPAEALRASKVLAFDADGNVTVSTETLTEIEGAATSAAAAALSATDAANSAVTAANEATNASNSAATALSAALGFTAAEPVTGSISPTIADDNRTIYLADASSAPCSITLPEIGSNEGAFFVVQAVDAMNGITVARSGTDTINGGTSLAVTQDQVIWLIADDNTPDNWIAVQISALNTAVDRDWTGSQRSPFVIDNDGSFDMSAGHNFKCTPSGALTLQFTNAADGHGGTIIFINTGGNTITLGSEIVADAGFAASISGAGTYTLGYISDGTSVWIGRSLEMV